MNRNPDLIVSGNLAIDEVFGEEFFGGSAGNIAVNASLLGLDSGVVSVIGNDDSSLRYREYLDELGVNTEALQFNLQFIARCIISSSQNHSSSKKWIDNGVSQALKEYEVDGTSTVDAVHDASFLHMTTTPPELGIKLSRLASADTVIGYEPGPRIHYDFSFFSEEVVKSCKYLFLNEEEATTVDQKFGLKRVIDQMSSTQSIILTLGKLGARVISRDESIDVPLLQHVEDDELKDASGAGDAFKAGIYVGLSRGLSLLESVQYANNYGYLMVQQAGAIFNADNLEKIRKITLALKSTESEII